MNDVGSRRDRFSSWMNENIRETYVDFGKSFKRTIHCYAQQLWLLYVAKLKTSHCWNSICDWELTKIFNDFKMLSFSFFKQKHLKFWEFSFHRRWLSSLINIWEVRKKMKLKVKVKRNSKIQLFQWNSPISSLQLSKHHIIHCGNH